MALASSIESISSFLDVWPVSRKIRMDVAILDPEPEMIMIQW